jgi:hypothetical protein
MKHGGAFIHSLQRIALCRNKETRSSSARNHYNITRRSVLSIQFTFSVDKGSGGDEEDVVERYVFLLGREREW